MDDLDAYYQNLVRWEGKVNWMYLDTHALVTCGIGNLLKTVDDALALTWLHSDGSEAPEDEVRQRFSDVSNMKAGMPAGKYRVGLTLSDEDVSALAVQRLQDEFLPGLRRTFDGFDDYPLPARECLVDLEYNLGVKGLSKFSHLIAACETGDFVAASRSCSVKTSRPERNAWRQAKFEECA